MRVFVAGATGFVGSRLVARLVAADHDVTVLTRSGDRARQRPWGDRVRVVEGEITDSRVVTDAAFGADVAVHLVHSMEQGIVDFARAEQRAASTLAEAATLAGVDHIVYLGGLADEREDLSPHLRSRIRTGEVLADHGPSVTELRASIVLGAGSASYELIRFASRTPVPLLVHPSWATGRCQPIAITDLLDVLVEVVEHDPTDRHRILEVGGPETGAYHDLVDVMRSVRGRVPNVSGPVPAPPPVLTGALVAQLTPFDPGTVGPLVASLAHDSVVSGRHESWLGTVGVADAMRASLAGRGEFAAMPGDPDWVGADLDVGLLVDVLQRLPHLPRQLVGDRLTTKGLLETAADVATAVRRG